MAAKKSSQIMYQIITMTFIKIFMTWFTLRVEFLHTKRPGTTLKFFPHKPPLPEVI